MADTEARAVAKYLRVSPRKAQQITNMIKGKPVGEAATMLNFTPKGAARLVGKVLESASANAEKNHSLRRENLYVAEAYANEGPTLKRWRPRAQGRAARIRKRTSHVTVVLRQKEQ